MRTIVDIEKNNKHVNGKIVQFARDFNFKVRLCKFRAGYTKGSNEALIYFKGKLETIHEIALNITNRINYKNEYYKEMMIDKVKENELYSIV